MKRNLLLTSLLLSAVQALFGHSPEPVNPPAELPDGISVAPAQGFVDTSNNAFPKGVSGIGLTFTQEIMPNPENTEPATLYYQDFSTPAEETLTATIDIMTWMTGGVLFKERVWTLPGLYKIEIPEGMFLFVDGVDADGERTGSAHAPGVTLYYEIYRGYTVLPGSGTVERIDGAVLRFPDAFEVRPTDLASEIQFYMDNSADEYAYSYEITDEDGDGRVNDVVFSFLQSGRVVTAPGVYGLNIPAGAFEFRISADGAPSEDYTEWKNQEILVKYTIPHAPRPEMDPDPDYAVKSFDTFLMYLPDGFELWFPDTMGQSPLYGVDEDGVVDTTRVYAYAKAQPYEEGDPFITLRLYDPLTHQMLDSYTPPTAGMYCLRTVPSLLFGSWAPSLTGGEEYTGGSDAYDYFYTVESDLTGVSCPGIEADLTQPRGVYTLLGVKVADTATESLPGGLYISGGRKILVK